MSVFQYRSYYERKSKNPLSLAGQRVLLELLARFELATSSLPKVTFQEKNLKILKFGVQFDFSWQKPMPRRASQRRNIPRGPASLSLPNPQRGYSMERDQPLTPPYAQSRHSTQTLTRGGPPGHRQHTHSFSEQYFTSCFQHGIMNQTKI